METEKGEVAYGLVSGKKKISSEVENTLTWDCFLNAFSCAQIGQSSFNAKANKSIYTKPIFLSFSNLPFFTLFPSSMHSSSVNLLSLSNSSSLASIKSLASLNFTNSSTPFAKSDMSTLNRSGILITTSAISIAYNYIDHAYINNFGSLAINDICKQSPEDYKRVIFSLSSLYPASLTFSPNRNVSSSVSSLCSKILSSFCSRTCLLTSCKIQHKKEKQNMPPAKQFGQAFPKLDTWCKSTQGLRMENKKEIGLAVANIANSEVGKRRNPNIKYYQIPGKSQLLNPNVKACFGNIGVWDLFGSIGIYWYVLGFSLIPI